MTSRFQILFFLDQVQDLDVILPVLEETELRGNLTAGIWITDRLFRHSPRTVLALQEKGRAFRVVRRLPLLFGIMPALRPFSALVMAAESSLRPHLAYHRLTRAANKRGLLTCTIQHGLEQPGLTYYDEVWQPRGVKFASKIIFLWGNKDTLHEDVPAEVRERCIFSGCPKRLDQTASLPALGTQGKKIVSVFENLHWHRYGEGYRYRFLEDLAASADKRPDIFFLVKPHHDERWLARNPQPLFAKLANLKILDPRDPQWEPFTAQALIAASDAVITTPSTVAFDAVRAGKQTAIAGYGLKLSLYESLTILQSQEDWLKVLRDFFEPEQQEIWGEAGRRFLERAGAAENGAKTIVDFIAKEEAQLGRI